MNFAGNCEEAFNLYKSVFGGEFVMLQRYKDMPPEAGNISESQRDKILHVSLPIGNNILMGSDSPESQQLTVGNNVYISISAESKEETKGLFDGLSAGGEIQMPLADIFWGAYFGMFRDKFGIQWMVSYEYKK